MSFNNCMICIIQELYTFCRMNITLLTSDNKLHAYHVKLLWNYVYHEKRYTNKCKLNWILLMSWKALEIILLFIMRFMLTLWFHWISETPTAIWQQRSIPLFQKEFRDPFTLLVRCYVTVLANIFSFKKSTSINTPYPITTIKNRFVITLQIY